MLPKPREKAYNFTYALSHAMFSSLASPACLHELEINCHLTRYNFSTVFLTIKDHGQFIDKMTSIYLLVNINVVVTLLASSTFLNFTTEMFFLTYINKETTLISFQYYVGVWLT